jgi:hypothetical protein
MGGVGRRVAVGLTLLVAVGACSLVRGEAFPDGPYRGRVIDSETKEPLGGAVVLLYWNESFIAPGHPDRFLDAEETLTDADGRFVIGRSRPRPSSPRARVDIQHMLIFTPGYGAFPDAHTAPPWPPTGDEGLFEQMARASVTFELPKFRTREERLKTVDLLDPAGVPEEKKPNFIRLLLIEKRQLRLYP